MAVSLRARLRIVNRRVEYARRGEPGGFPGAAPDPVWPVFEISLLSSWLRKTGAAASVLDSDRRGF